MMKTVSPNTPLADMSDADQAAAVNARMLSLPQYLTLSRRIIGKFAPGSMRIGLLRDDDAIGYVAHGIMMGDWRYNHDRSKLGTYRGYSGRVALLNYISRRCLPSLTVPFAADDTGGSQHHEAIDEDIRVESRASTSAFLRRAMGVLSRNQQAYLVMHFADGMDYKQIAAAVGCSRENIRRQVDSALRKLSRPDD